MTGNDAAAQWFHSPGVFVIKGGRGCIGGETAQSFHVSWGLALSEERQQAATITHTHTDNSYKLIHSNNNPCPRLLQHALQPANSFRCEVEEKGRWVRGLRVVIVMLCNWQCESSVWCKLHTALSPLLGSDDKHFQEREGTRQDDRAIQRWRGYSFG